MAQFAVVPPQGARGAHHPALFVEHGVHLRGAQGLAVGHVEQAGKRLPGQFPRVAADDGGERGIGLDDVAARIEQGLADPRIAHRIAEALLAAPIRRGHVLRDALRARLGRSQHPGQGKQQQGRPDPGDQQLVDRIQLRCRAARRSGEKVEAPAPPIKRQLQAVGEGVDRADAGIREQHHLRRVGDVDHAHAFVAPGRGDRGLQHRADAERGIHPAFHRQPTLRRIGRRQHGVVDRAVQQQAGNRGGAALFQRHHAAHAGLATVDGRAHGRLRHRIGVHVAADRAHVGDRTRLQVDGWPVLRAPAMRIDAEAAIAGVADQQLQVGQAGRVGVGRETEPGHGWESVLQRQSVHVAAPVFRRRPFQRGEQRGPAAQGEFETGQAQLQQRSQLADRTVELRLGDPEFALACVVPGGEHEAQRDQQHQHRERIAETPPEARCRACVRGSRVVRALRHRRRITAA